MGMPHNAAALNERSLAKLFAIRETVLVRLKRSDRRNEDPTPVCIVPLKSTVRWAEGTPLCARYCTPMLSIGSIYNVYGKDDDDENAQCLVNVHTLRANNTKPYALVNFRDIDFLNYKGPGKRPKPVQCLGLNLIFCPQTHRCGRPYN